MKREQIKGILPGIADEQLQQVMDLHGADIEAHKQSIATLTAERDAARAHLADANTKLAGYDPEWQQKAQQARQQADQKVKALQAQYAAGNAAAALRFTSAAARRAFMADLEAKNLPLQEDGSLLGFDDFVSSYKKADPAAFVQDGYPNVKDGGDPASKPAGSAREQFAAWFEQAIK